MSPRALPSLLAAAWLASCAVAPVPSTPASSQAVVGGAPMAAPRAFERSAPPGPMTRPAWRAPAASVRVLASGLRVVVVEQHQRPIVLVRLVLPGGAAQDPPQEAGRTWLAVHLASDYYEKSATGADLFEEKSFRRQVAELGGSSAFTVTADASILGISGFAADTRKYLRALGGAIRSPRHGAESFHARRNSLLDAIDDLELADPEALEHFLMQAAFGSGHPYSRPLFGTRASLEKLVLEDVVARQRSLFTPRGATLLIVGDVEPQAALDAADAAFKTWRGSAAPTASIPPPSAASRSPDVGFVRRQPASTLIACAARAVKDGSGAALDVLAAVLGRSGQGRLAAALRDEHGLTYQADAWVLRRKRARALIACARLRADRSEQGIGLFRKVLEEVRAGPLSQEEIQRAKAALIAEAESGFDGAQASAELWLEAISTGAGAPRVEQTVADLEKVTAEGVQSLARAALAPEALRWVLSGEQGSVAAALGGNAMGALRRLTSDW